MHEDIVLTPMMKQFLDLKAKHPDAVMLFRCGDFYETYSTDAVVASEILGITLTKRANGKGKTIEMAGFPASCARHLSAQADTCRQACGHLRPVGGPEADEETGEARHHGAGDAGSFHQRQCAELPGEQLPGCRAFR